MKNKKLKIISDSMQPIIKIGDEIEIQPIKFNELKRFDIILFYNAHKPVCHFFWCINGINKNEFLTRSLKQPKFNDLPTPKNSLVGKVTNFKISLYYRIKITILNIL